MDSCPCGRPGSYADCCQVFHAGQPAPTAERLMRSRFTAFARADGAYLLHSWHPDHRPARIRFDPAQRWLRLEILGGTAGGLFDQAGTVDFRAGYQVGRASGELRENSRFGRFEGRWVYLGPV